jgi:hypothetical protein
VVEVACSVAVGIETGKVVGRIAITTGFVLETLVVDVADLMVMY